MRFLASASRPGAAAMDAFAAIGLPDSRSNEHFREDGLIA
jgi:hypothetical protein